MISYCLCYGPIVRPGIEAGARKKEAACPEAARKQRERDEEPRHTIIQDMDCKVLPPETYVLQSGPIFHSLCLLPLVYPSRMYQWTDLSISS